MSARSAMPAANRSQADDSFLDDICLHGMSASAGCASGRARIVRTPWDATRVRSSDILVCETVTRALLPLLAVAAGVITEMGGPLSNAAIVIRERGIPAVFAVTGATARLRDGHVVTVDGARGLVRMQGAAE